MMRTYRNMSVQDVASSEAVSELVIDDVRISPSNIKFLDPFECRKYTKTLCIQNCGNRRAFIRILKPTSCHFHVKSEEQGIYLSAGLKITKKIKFTFFQNESVCFATLPIIINSKPAQITLDVLIESFKELTISPTTIDLGIVNVGQISLPQIVTLTNEDTRHMHFAVETHLENSVQVLVTPKKGKVEPRQKKTLMVQGRGSNPGTFEISIWIRSELPLTLTVKMEIIDPVFRISAPMKTTDFILLDFSFTYIGSYSRNYICVVNSNASNAVYCILGELNKKLLLYSECVKLDPSMKCFTVKPMEGYFDANTAQIITFTYTPEFTSSFNIQDNIQCNFSIIQIIRLDCDKLCPRLEECEGESMISDIKKKNSKVVLADSSIQLLNSFDIVSVFSVNMQTTNNIRICLHGLAKRPRVSVIPDSIIINKELLPKEKINRVLKITNNCKSLPIILQYEKIAYIDVQPNYVELQVFQSVELMVALSPRNIGTEKQKIKFNLLYKPEKHVTSNVGTLCVPITYKCKSVVKVPEPEFVMGITPFTFNEVGRNVEDIRFNNSIPFPRLCMIDDGRMQRQGCDLIAFPNDRARSLRNWTNPIPIRTIFTRIPRLICIDQQVELEIEMQHQNREYYKEYLKKEAAKRGGKLPPLPPFEIEGHSKKLRPIKCSANINQMKTINAYCLSPLDLYFVTIMPKIVNLGKIAQMSCVHSHFSVCNDNPFPVEIRMRAPNSNFLFLNGNRMTVKKTSCINVKFIYSAINEEGLFDVFIDVIINDSALVIVTLIGEICKKALEVSPTLLEFSDGDDYLKYVELFNPYTCCISFNVEHIEGCFSFIPTFGEVEPSKSLICMVKYDPNKSTRSMEFEIVVNGLFCETIRVRAISKKGIVTMNPDALILGNIPINIPFLKTVILENLGAGDVSIRLIEPNKMPGITVYQRKNILRRCSYAILTFEFKMNTIGPFSYSYDFDTQVKKVSLSITGNVVLPVIKIRPNLLTFRKIQNHSFDMALFLIENTSDVDAHVEFVLDEYREFSLSESATEESKKAHAINLKRGEQKRLCMFFNPLDIAPNSFFLPLVINDLCSTDALSNHFPKVKVSTNVTQEGICFSKTNFELRYYPHPKFDTITQDTLRIYNAGDKKEWFCWRTDSVHPEIGIGLSESYNNRSITDMTKNCISAMLLPGEEVNLSIYFQPIKKCSFRCKTPVYVKDQMNGAVFKYIYISGYFPSPTLTVNHPIIYLEPVPLKTVSQMNIELTAQYHPNLCSYRAEVDEPDLKVNLKGSTLIDSRYITNIFKIAISFSTCQSKSIEEEIIFSCSCGAECKALVKVCSENCFLTNHAFLRVFCEETMNLYSSSHVNGLTSAYNVSALDMESMSIMDMSNIVEVAVNKNETTFPYFPHATDESDYAIHMNCTLRSVERWVNIEGFYGTKWRNIPDGFMVSTITNAKNIDIPIVNLLRNISGSIITNLVVTPPSVMEEEILVQFFYNTYYNVKVLLSKCGAFIPNVEPEYLLIYEQYVIYMTKILPQIDPEKYKRSIYHSYYKFVRLSKQNWLDLLLQIYKVFQLKNNKMSEKQNKFDSSLTLDLEVGIYNTVENILLTWLEQIYNNNRNLFKHHNLGIKKVRLFDFDLNDGTIFGVVTASYCKYLLSEFKGFYWKPKNDNEIQYNACKLVQIWEMLHCRFKMKPWDITIANSFDMLMFVNNLFDFLPGLVPLETIDMFAPLSNTYTKSIEIGNSNSFVLKFTLHFFNNEHKSFSTNVTELTLQPGKSKMVEVTYIAKFHKNVEAQLLFNGENCGFHLARTRVYHLFGHTDLKTPYCEIVLTATTYISKFVTQVITSPYKAAATYEIFMVENNDPDNIEMSSFKESYQVKIPRKLYFAEELVCDENGVGKMDFHISVIVSDCEPWLLLFSCPTVGDFLISLKFKIKLRKMWENVSVGIRSTFINGKCICSTNRIPNCPKIVKANILCKNLSGYECLRSSLFKQLTNDLDMEFWDKHYNSPAGSAVLLRHLEDDASKQYLDYKAILQSFDEKEIILLEDRPTLELPKNLTVDCYHQEYVNMIMHINEDGIPKPFEVILRNKLKIDRYLKIKFEQCE